MLKLDEEEHEYCADCGDDLDFDDDGDYCWECGDGPFCSSCLLDHEENVHPPKCTACGKVLEIDPPCPICHREFCDDCVSGHVRLCQANEDRHLGLQPTLFHFIFEDGLT